MILITATGTGVGKTFVTRALGRAALRRGLRPIGIKPLETGCAGPGPDAAANARASATPAALAHDPCWYRAAAPLAPWAATREGAPPPDLAAIEVRLRALDASAAPLLVEGAGGVLVPIDASTTFADFAQRLGATVLVVAADVLGTLSHTRTALECLRARGVEPAGVVLVTSAAPDPSTRTNRAILAEHAVIFPFPCCEDDDDSLADAAESSGLTRLLS